MATDPESSITWRSRLSSTGIDDKIQFLTTKKEFVTGLGDLYKPYMFLLHTRAAEDCKSSHWFGRFSETSIVLGRGIQRFQSKKMMKTTDNTAFLNFQKSALQPG